MDFNSTIDLIIRELEEAREIIDDLKMFPGSPLLQIELAKSKCKNAADVIALIKEYRKAETPVSLSQPEPLKKEETKKAVLQEIESKIREIDDKPEPSETERPVIAEIEDPKATILPPKNETKVKQREPQETLDLADDMVQKHDTPEKDNAPEPNKPFVAPIIADTFSHLANRFSEKPEDDDYSYPRRKLSNLSEAIGINDRFYYIREIFEGNRDAYSQAITRLENSQSLEDAKNILLKSTGNKADQHAIKQLLDLVRRKLAGHE